VAQAHVERLGDPGERGERRGRQVTLELADEPVCQAGRGRQLRDGHPPLLAERAQAIANWHGDGHAVEA
jgi:hypothetical protein